MDEGLVSCIIFHGHCGIVGIIDCTICLLHAFYVYLMTNGALFSTLFCPVNTVCFH